MRDRPSGADLLAIARRTLTETILPGLADDRRIAALMVARAIEIAEREAAGGDAAQRAFAAAVAMLYGEAPPALGRADDVAAAARRLAARLARDLRAGTLDQEKRAKAWRILMADADVRVAESNPRYRDSG